MSGGGREEVGGRKRRGERKRGIWVEEGGGDGQVEEIKAGTFPGREGEAKGKSGEKITRDATTLR